LYDYCIIREMIQVVFAMAKLLGEAATLHGMHKTAKVCDTEFSA